MDDRADRISTFGFVFGARIDLVAAEAKPLHSGPSGHGTTYRYARIAHIRIVIRAAPITEPRDSAQPDSDRERGWAWGRGCLTAAPQFFALYLFFDQKESLFSVNIRYLQYILSRYVQREGQRQLRRTVCLYGMECVGVHRAERSIYRNSRLAAIG